MSRFRITYSGSRGRWTCRVYDRKKDVEHIGHGPTKKDAREDAWDSVYDVDSGSSSDTSSEGSMSYFGIGVLFGIGVGFFVGFYQGCGLFHYNEMGGEAYLFDIDDALKGILLYPIAGAILGFIADIISNSKKNNE